MNMAAEKYTSMLESLRSRIAKADHKPGTWHECKHEPGRICTLPIDQHSSDPETVLEFLKGFGSGHDGIGREFSSRDIELVLETINNLPDILDLAVDGLKYRRSIDHS